MPDLPCAAPDLRLDLTLVGPDGRAHDLAVLARPDTAWGELAGRLPSGCERPWCGGRRLDPVSRLGHDGLCQGAVLRVAGPSRPDSAVAAGGHRLDVVGGPDAGRSVPLGRTPALVGRARDCALVLRDPRVSRVHALVGLTADGGYARDRGSAAGTSVGVTPVGTEPVAAPPGRYVRVGDSLLRVTAARPRTALTTPGPQGTALVHRPPAGFRPAAGAAAEIAVPDPPPPAPAHRVPWLAAAAPAMLAGVLALVLHSPTFLLFAVLSPLALLGSALGERLHRRRGGRRAGRAHRAALAAARTEIAAALSAETERRRTAAPDPVTVAQTAALPGAALWERGPTTPGRLAVRLGLGDLPARTRMRDRAGPRPAGTLRSVPGIVDLAAGPVGITGPAPIARAVARWALAQLSVQVVPRELQIRLLLSPDGEPHWRWARWLPHLHGAPALDRAEAVELVAELAALRELRANGAAPHNAPWDGPWTVLVIDECRAVADLPGLVELLRAGRHVGITAITVSTQPAALPAACATVATVAGDTGSRLTVTAGPGEPVTLIADQVSPGWCERLARALAPLRDGTTTAEPPPSCTLPQLLGLDPVSPTTVDARWRASDGSLSTALGTSADGPVWLDLVRDGPHALVAGTTGAGKSELLRSLVAGLALAHPPDEVGFVLVDYKGGAAFTECARLPHTLGVVTDLDAQLAARALESLECELRRREQLFADAGVRDYASYRADRDPATEATPRLVIVVDEFAELAAELSEFVTGLVGIARRGRSLGVHLVLATQRPAGVVSPEIRANTTIRIALRVADPGDSRDVIEVGNAAMIDRRNPGRAYLRVGGSAPLLLQTALAGTAGPSPDEPVAPVRVVQLDDWRRPRRAAGSAPPALAEHPDEAGLGALVDVIGRAAAAGGWPKSASPWLPPLPRQLALDELPAGGNDQTDQPQQVPLGLVDVPRHQQQVRFTVDLGGGSLLLAGGSRSGRTSALITLAGAAAARLGPDRLHVHAIDQAGGGLAELAELPHLGSLVSDDIAATGRLLARLSAEVARRRAGEPSDRTPQPADPALLLLLDGWEQFLAAAERHDAHEPVEALLALLRTGPAAGVSVALAGDRGTFAPRLSAAVRTKLVLPLTDRADYALAGVASRAVPGDPSAGRAVRAEDGAQVQLAHLGAAPTVGERRRKLTEIARRWSHESDGRQPIRVRPLPAVVRLDSLPHAPGTAPHPDAPRSDAVVTLGVGGDAAEPLVANLRSGRARMLVAGPPGSGRSTLLLCLLGQLVRQGQRVTVAAPEHSPLAAAARGCGAPLLTPDDDPPTAADPAPDRAGPGQFPVGPAAGAPDVVLVDDCEQFRDRSAEAWLTGWATAPAGPAVVVAGCSDDLAVAFRGIATVVRRTRCGVLLRPGPGDGELLGLRLARRRADGPPGRGILLGDPAWEAVYARGPLPIQVALP